jgi:hypothetical protein
MMGTRKARVEFAILLPSGERAWTTYVGEESTKVGFSLGDLGSRLVLLVRIRNF